jgi:hypothetical protein
VIPRSRRSWLASLALLSLGACGWHTGLVAPGGGRSVGVEVFDTAERVLERNLEPRLHDELSRAVSDLVDAPLVEARDADLVIRGRIAEYRRRGGIRSSDNELLESGLRLRITAELVRGSTGELLGNTSAEMRSGYVLEGLGAETAARDRALRSIAETLVLDLFHPRVEDAPTGENADGGGE